MKKTLLLLALTAMTNLLSAQYPPSVDEATQAWAKQYNLNTEQTKAALKIQQDKWTALQKIEKIKHKNPELYNTKRLSAIETAENELAVVLDNRQIVLLKTDQAERSKKYNETVQSLKKKGATDKAIQQHLAEISY